MVVTTPLHTLRDLIYTNWSCSTPSTSTISSTGLGFCVAPRNMKFTGRAVVISRDVDYPDERSLGTDPPILHQDYVRVAAYTNGGGDLTTAQVEYEWMLYEIERIVHSLKTGSGDIKLIDLVRGGRPILTAIKPGDVTVAEDKRIRLWYIR